MGDIDNDGDLDIFQAGGGGVAGGTTPSPSFLFSNLGEGRFANVANEAGLSILYEVPPTYLSENAIATLVDIDNDGELDLLIGAPFIRLFENNGDGTFVEQTSRLGINSAGFFSFADFDGDGFLDVWVSGSGVPGEFTSSDPALYRNNGNDNHYLRVELVGIQSNRNGIGARLVATSGNLQQTRDIFGGNGFTQEEIVVHFGLGAHTQVDQLEIHWPSGVVDVLSDVPADQKIRVFEGREDYHVVHPAVWENNFPDSVLVGETIDLIATVRPALFEAGAQITRVTADLSGLGGPEAVPLMNRGDGTYRLEPVILAVGDLTGLKIVSILIEQATLLGPYWTNLSKGIRVPVGLPTEDLVIFADALADIGQVQAFQGKLDFQEDTVVHQGQFALAVESGPSPVGGPPGEGFAFIYLLADPVDPLSYKSLSFSFHPGDAIRPSEGEALFNVDFRSAGTPNIVELLEEDIVDLDLKDWQEVEIGLEALELTEPIEGIGFFGNLEGTFFLDDIRLVTARAITAVLEEHIAGRPQGFTLEQNFPNPFNPQTVIRFDHPVGGHVKLSVFNLMGQKLATLVDGHRSDGSYLVVWDGKDDNQKSLASGVYLYRMETDGFVKTRKLVLVK